MSHLPGHPSCVASGIYKVCDNSALFCVCFSHELVTLVTKKQWRVSKSLWSEFHSPSFFLLAVSLFRATVMEASHRENIPSRFGGEQAGRKHFTTEVTFQTVCWVNTHGTEVSTCSLLQSSRILPIDHYNHPPIHQLHLLHWLLQRVPFLASARLLPCSGWDETQGKLALQWEVLGTIPAAAHCSSPLKRYILQLTTKTQPPSSWPEAMEITTTHTDRQI